MLYIGFWMTVFIVALVDKWITDSSLSVWQHYTNISWFFHAAVYAFIFGGQVAALRYEDCGLCCGRSRQFNHAGFANATYYLDGVLLLMFWPLFATALVVYVVVFIIIYTTPQLLAHLLIEYGGKYTLGQLVVGNELYHSIPVIVDLGLLIAMQADVMRAFYRLCYLLETPYRELVAVWGVYIAPIALIFFYSLVVNYHDVYSTSVSMANLTVTVLLVLTLCAGFFYLVCLLNLPHYRRRIFQAGGHVFAR